MGRGRRHSQGKGAQGKGSPAAAKGGPPAAIGRPAIGGAPKGGSGSGGRARVSSKRITGQIVQWRGKFGWIRPNEPIDHPKAQDRGGRVYVGIEDVDGPELSNKCMVSFIVYADESGLGAMHCKKTGAAPPEKPPAKGAAGKGGVIKTNLKQLNVARPAPLVAKRLLPKGKGKGEAESKGKGKGEAKKGEGKGAGKAGRKERVGGEEGEEKGPRVPDKAARERIVTTRVVGKLVKWRGPIGWIRPLDKIEDPDVPKHRRGIYLHEVDVMKGNELFQGAQVDFFIYKDADGVGAEHCRLTKDQPPPDAEPRQQPKATKAKGKGKGEAKGAGKAVKKTMVEKEKLSRRARRRGGKRAGKGKDGEKPEKAEKPEKSGPDLPRERVTDMPVTGEVVVWKGKFGWLRATEEISHALAERHDGKLYIHEKDILDGAPLTVGQQVEFHVYADASGLGAEEAIATSTAS